MSYTATVYKVMIASPSDVAAERSIIRGIVNSWNVINSDSRKIVLLPIGWETHSSPAMGDRPQEIINKQILKDCDLLVGVFWTRIGTPTGEHPSGTVEEIEEHIKAGKPTMLYFSSAPVLPDSIDQDQYEKLKAFKESCKTRGIFEQYSDHNDFKEKFDRQLQIKINQDKYFIQDPAKDSNPQEDVKTITEHIPTVFSSSPLPPLTKEAQALLVEASNDSHGHIIRLHHLGGVSIQTNKKSFAEGHDPKNRALWEGVIDELERFGLIKATSYKREIFTVTREGYDLATILAA